MIQGMRQFFIIGGLVIFGIGLLVCVLRLIKGGSSGDRVVSLDGRSGVVMCIVGVMSVIMGSV